MNNFRKLAHLVEQVGEEGFAALIDSGNTGAVKAFVATLPSVLPTEITLAGRIYEIPGFLREREESIGGHEMVERAKEMRANLGEEDGRWFLDHQSDIPVALRRKVAFVFPDWRNPDAPESVYCVCWYDDRWVGNWCGLGYRWSDYDRLPRRK